MNSPKIAPRVAAAAPIWRPVITAGIDEGPRTNRSFVVGPPPHARTIVSGPPSAERSPSIVPTSVVKNTASAARSTFARSGSNVSCKSGMTATRGNTVQGQREAQEQALGYS